MAIMPPVESQGAFLMNRLITLMAVALLAVASATPAFAQGRFGSEAAQRQADREEREAIRRAEHPELYEKTAAAKPAEAPAQQEAAAPTQPATEPVAAAPAPATAAPAH